MKFIKLPFLAFEIGFKSTAGAWRTAFSFYITQEYRLAVLCCLLLVIDLDALSCCHFKVKVVKKETGMKQPIKSISS